MEAITKAEFIRRITQGKSVMIGISPKMDESEIAACKRNMSESHHMERTAKAKGMHITFSNDNHLWLDDKERLEIKCYAEDNILIVKQKFINRYYGFPDEIVYKCLYYAIV